VTDPAQFGSAGGTGRIRDDGGRVEVVSSAGLTSTHERAALERGALQSKPLAIGLHDSAQQGVGSGMDRCGRRGHLSPSIAAISSSVAATAEHHCMSVGMVIS